MAKKIQLLNGVLELPETLLIPWEGIVIHHSLTRDNITLNDTEAIRRYHINTNGWRDIGYHFLIEQDRPAPGGLPAVIIRPGRHLNEYGAHTLGRNTKDIGICIVGNFDTAEPDKELTRAAVELCGNLLCEIPTLDIRLIKPHSFYAPYKTCPGHLLDWTNFILDIQAGQT